MYFPLLRHSELNSLFVYQPERLEDTFLVRMLEKRKLYFLQLKLPVVFAFENWSLMFFIRKYLEWLKKKCEAVTF